MRLLRGKAPGRGGTAGTTQPRFDYKKRTIDNKLYWSNDYLDDEGAQQLTEQGYIAFIASFKHGRALLNEVSGKAHLALGEIAAPMLIVHGTKDTFVPVESSRAAVSQFQIERKLVEIEGA